MGARRYIAEEWSSPGFVDGYGLEISSVSRELLS